MSQLDALRDRLPDAARDLKVNLQNVLGEQTLNEAQRFGVAVACAWAARSPQLARALIAEAHGAVDPAVFDDALAAASIMGMNNVFYRFRHKMERESYSARPARLRMTRIARVATNKIDFELFCLAVSAINDCEACVKAHEKTVLEGGLSEDHVFDAVRIASIVHAVAVALDAAEPAPTLV